jgi:MFS family permease
MIQPIIPVLVREVDPAGLAATISGIAFALMGLLAAASSFGISRLAERISLKKLLVISCFITSLLYLPPVWAMTIAQLVIFVALTGLPKGGLMTSSQALVGLSVTQAQQGIAYGVAQSANSLGNGLGPLLGGVLAPIIGLRGVFAVGTGLYFVIGIAAAKWLKEIRLEKPETDIGQVSQDSTE